MIRFIYFDLGNVLLDFSHDLACEQLSVLAGLSAARVNEVVYESGLSHRYESGEISTVEFHAVFEEATDVQTQLADFERAFSDIFEIKSRTIPIVASLCATGNRIGILSNTCAAHWEFVVKRFPSLVSFFDPVVTSYGAKSMKPDAAIYEQAATRAGVAPHEIFFTDDRAENVEGALQCGWQARLFTGAPQLSDDLAELGVRFNR